MIDILLLLFYTGFSIQVFYFLFIFSRLIFFKESHFEGIKGVSVIIAAHNEEKNLAKLIPLLLDQDHTDFEIIIANDRSTDGSAAVLKKYAGSILKVVDIEKTPSGYNSKKYALTRAIETAGKEILLLTDADCFPRSRKWIKAMQSAFVTGKEVVTGYSPYQEKAGYLNMLIRYETFYTAVQYLSFAIIKQPYMGVGRNLAYLKSLFETNSGFSGFKEVTGGDDDLFVGKVARSGNVAVRIARESQMVSVPKEKYSDFVRQKIRHLSAGKKYRVGNKLKSGLLPLSHFFLYFSFVFLIFSDIYISVIVSAFILRTLLLIIIFALISRKLGETIKWQWFPVLDLSLFLNYIITGTLVVFSKNIKWT